MWVANTPKFHLGDVTACLNIQFNSLLFTDWREGGACTLCIPPAYGPTMNTNMRIIDSASIAIHY